MNNLDGVHVSVRGSSHIKSGMVCQDFSSIFVSELFCMAVVCDGHGSSKHFRSAVGAKKAAEVAIESVKEFTRCINELPLHNDENSLQEDELAKLSDKKKLDKLVQLEKSIIHKWNNEVTLHKEEHSFQEDELSALTDKEKAVVSENHYVAYGTTLIVVAMSDSYCFGIKIGDGDCMAIDENGNVFDPVPENRLLQFNITTSLCDKKAISNFRHFWREEPVAGVVISTDGVRNSFENTEFYNVFCRTMLKDIDETGDDWSKDDLESFLAKLSEHGSGDDVSVAVVFDRVALGKALRSKDEKVPREEIISNEGLIVTDKAASSEGAVDGFNDTSSETGAEK